MRQPAEGTKTGELSRGHAEFVTGGDVKQAVGYESGTHMSVWERSVIKKQI